MFDTVIVYTFVLISLLSLSFIAAQRAYPVNRQSVSFGTWEISLMLFIFTFVFGLRYEVGIDYSEYAYIYQHPDNGRDDIEFLFASLSDVLRQFGMPLGVYFSLWAFLQFFFLLYSFKDERHLYPCLIIVFICGQYFLLWMNAIRQDLATCIFIFAIKYIQDKKLWKYLFWILIASGIHRTAVVLLLFYPVFYYIKDYTKKIPVVVQLLALFVCAVLYASNFNILGDVDELLAVYLVGTDYEEYTRGAIAHTTQDSVLGLSFLSGFFIDLTIIVFSNKLKDYYSSERFTIFYNLYLLGALLGLLFGSSFLLLRPVRYFRFFKMIVTPYLIYYLLQHWNRNLLYLASLFVVLLMLMVQYVALFFYSSDSMYQYHFLLFEG